MEVSHRRKNEILSFVKTIFEMKKKAISADMLRMEREIDLVYGLQEKEIAVIEENNKLL